TCRRSHPSPRRSRRRKPPASVRSVSSPAPPPARSPRGNHPLHSAYLSPPAPSTSLIGLSDNTVAPVPPAPPTPLTLLGLGAMGAALARTWLAAGHPLTVWNRSPGRSAELAAAGARVAATAAEAVAASPLVVTCLLDDASVRAALADADLTGRDLVDLTTST